MRLNALTMPDFLAKRYDSPGLKILAALIIFIFLVPYSASVYMGLSYLFEKIFNIPFSLALAIIAALTAVYLVMGGYLAVALTNFVQGIVMLAGVVLLVCYIMADPHIGGIATGIARLGQINPQFVRPFNPPNPLGLFSLVVLTSLGAWGMPQMVQKFYAISDVRAIPPAKIVSTFFSMIIAFGAYFTGSFGRVFFNNELPNGNFDIIMPLMIRQALPEAASVLILLLILAASMSTLASLVLVSSSSIAIDLMKGFFRPNMSEKSTMSLMRWLSLLFIALSAYIALKPTFILSLMSLSWGTVSGAFLAPYLYGLFWKDATRAGAWAGMLTGVLFSVSLSFYCKMNSSLIPIIGSAAMLIPLIVLPAVSVLTPKLSANHLANIFEEDEVQRGYLHYSRFSAEEQ
jgi:SSS family solute:Na+ symporter